MIGAAMAKKKPAKKPYTPSTPWDHGATGPANQSGLTVERAPNPNPNGVTRSRRKPVIETYLDQGRITPGQYQAALALVKAHQGYRSEDPLAAISIRERSQTRPEPAAAIFDARRVFYPMWRRIPMHAQFVVEWVVLEDKAVASVPHCTRGRATQRYMQRLCDGLEAIRG